MSTLPFHAKNLSTLPLPDVVENLDYADLLQRRYDYFNGLSPVLFSPQREPVLQPAELVKTESGELYWKVPVDDEAGLYYLDLESDPIPRQFQVDAYMEMHYRNRVNQACLAMMPAFASGADLEHLASRDQVVRLQVAEATETTPAVWETDEALRRRWLLSREALSAGGSEGWYLYHALSADPLVKDAHALSPAPRGVDIVILSHEGNGTASPELLEKVEARLRSQYNAVMTDVITVKSAEVVEYTLEATLTYYHGVSNALVSQHIQRAFDGEPVPLPSGALRENFRLRTEKIGHWITDSQVKALLNPDGVYRAEVESPSRLPVEISPYQAAYCTGLTLRDGGEYGLL